VTDSIGLVTIAKDSIGLVVLDLHRVLDREEF
jgi:hypothetical protein